MAYLHSIVIYNTDWDSHLAAVLQSLREAGLMAKPAKCAVGKEEAYYLSHWVEGGQVYPLVGKVHALGIQDPYDQRQMHAFLGLAGCYRQFIPHFATI